jgi:hypothetical protein
MTAKATAGDHTRKRWVREWRLRFHNALLMEDQMVRRPRRHTSARTVMRKYPMPDTYVGHDINP